MKIRLPTILLALLLLTTPASATGLGNDKAAHITASAAAKSGMTAAIPTDIAQIGETLQRMQSAQYQQRALCGCITRSGDNGTKKYDG